MPQKWILTEMLERKRVREEARNRAKERKEKEKEEREEKERIEKAAKEKGRKRSSKKEEENKNANNRKDEEGKKKRKYDYWEDEDSWSEDEGAAKGDDGEMATNDVENNDNNKNYNNNNANANKTMLVKTTDMSNLQPSSQKIRVPPLTDCGPREAKKEGPLFPFRPWPCLGEEEEEEEGKADVCGEKVGKKDGKKRVIRSLLWIFFK